MGPFGAKRADGQSFRAGPVDPFAGFDRSPLRLELAGNLRVETKALGYGCEAAADFPEFRDGDSGLTAAVVVGGL